MAAVAPAPGTSPFERKEYNVTNTCEACGNCFLSSKTLILEPEEAVLHVQCTPCVDASTRRPYGELGSVDVVHACGCCYSFSSDLTPAQGDAPGGLSPGCGCEGDLVAEIVKELKARMAARGDTGNIIRAEQTLAQVNATREEVQQINAKLDMVINYLNSSSGGQMAQMQQMQVQAQQMQMAVGVPQQMNR